MKQATTKSDEILSNPNGQNMQMHGASLLQIPNIECLLCQQRLYFCEIEDLNNICFQQISLENYDTQKCFPYENTCWFFTAGHFNMFCLEIQDLPNCVLFTYK